MSGHFFAAAAASNAGMRSSVVCRMVLIFMFGCSVSYVVTVVLEPSLRARGLLVAPPPHRQVDRLRRERLLRRRRRVRGEPPLSPALPWRRRPRPRPPFDLRLIPLPPLDSGTRRSSDRRPAPVPTWTPLVNRSRVLLASFVEECLDANDDLLRCQNQRLPEARSRRHPDIRQAESGRRRVEIVETALTDSGYHLCAEAAGHICLMGDEDARCPTYGPEDRLLVERVEPPEVEHPNPDALSEEGGLGRLRDRGCAPQVMIATSVGSP